MTQSSQQCDCFFTRKILIKLAEINKTYLCTEATYKLIWQGFPVPIVGTTDKAKKFLPFWLAVCMKEESADFAFIFSSLRYAVNRV